MDEQKFLSQLKKRAEEQEQLIKGSPPILLKVSLFLGKNPWRVIIPLSILLSLLLRFVLGHGYLELVLKIFGKV